MIVASDFTTAFPEFADATTYLPAQISFWIPQAYQQLNAHRFGASLDLAAMLFVAHNITLSARAAKGNVGEVGVVSSKSVGSVSKSYDTGLTATGGAGFWNATSYGQRLYKMMQMFCTGPVYAVAQKALAPTSPLPPYPYPYYRYPGAF